MSIDTEIDFVYERDIRGRLGQRGLVDLRLCCLSCRHRVTSGVRMVSSAFGADDVWEIFHGVMAVRAVRVRFDVVPGAVGHDGVVGVS